jgi:hypothetical protein
MIEWNNHKLEITYHVEPEYWTFYLKIKVDNHETLRSMTYELPKILKIFSWVIEDIPVHIATDNIPYLHIYWAGIAIGINAKESVDIQPVLDYIRIHL